MLPHVFMVRNIIYAEYSFTDNRCRLQQQQLYWVLQKKKFNERPKQEEDVPHEYVFNISKYVILTLKTEIDTPKTCTYF